MARYIALARDNWNEIDGWAVSQQIEILDLTTDRFCNLLWWYATRNAEDPSDVKRFEARLWQPPKGVVPTSGPWEAQAETDALSALKAQLTGKASPTGGRGVSGADDAKGDGTERQ